MINDAVRKGHASARGDAVRVSAFFAALFLASGIQLPYLPVWLGWRGFTPQEIGIVLAAPLVARVALLPLLGLVSDRLGGGRAVLAGSAWCAAALLAALSGVEGFAGVLVLVVLVGVLWGALVPLTDAAALATGGDYGRMRLWGSIGFVIANVAGGLWLEATSAAAVLPLLVAAATLCGLIALTLPRGAPGARIAPPSIADALAILTRRRVLLVLLGAALAQASHAMFYGFGALHWRSQGLSGGTIGLLWAIGVVAEIALFWFSARAIARLGAPGLLALGAFAGALRWALTALDPPLLGLAVLQVAHALSFGAVHLGAVHALAKVAPPGLAGTTQSLLSSTSALVTALVTAATGPLYGAFGSGAYWGMAGVALAGGVLATLALTSPQPQSATSGGETTLPS